MIIIKVVSVSLQSKKVRFYYVDEFQWFKVLSFEIYFFSYFPIDKKSHHIPTVCGIHPFHPFHRQCSSASCVIEQPTITKTTSSQERDSFSHKPPTTKNTVARLLLAVFGPPGRKTGRRTASCSGKRRLRKQDAECANPGRCRTTQRLRWRWGS